MQPAFPVIALVAAVILGGEAAAQDGRDGRDALLADTMPARAVEVLTRAAEAGQADAQYSLGMLFLAGDIVTQDDAAAVRWLTQAAAAGHALAESNLGCLYLQGRGVPRDAEQAAQMLRRAAAKDVAAAQHNLGWMAQMGEGGPKDLDAARAWYAAAAQSGYSQSQYNLGVLLVGGGQDLAGAVQWLSLAAMSPHPDVRRRATERLVELSRILPPPVVSEGLGQARRWLAERRGV